MAPNKAFQVTPQLRFASLGFPRSLRSLGAPERRRWASMKRSLAAAISAVLLAGCAASPEHAAEEVNSTVGALSIETAARSAPNSRAVALDETLSVKVSDDNPVLVDGSRKARFQRLTVSLSQPAALRIEARTYCECFGSGKYIMVPRLVVAELLQSPAELLPKESHYQHPETFSAASLVYVWETPVLPAGTSALLVLADTSEAGGEVIRTDTSALPPGGRMVVELTGANRLREYPYGHFDMHVARVTK